MTGLAVASTAALGQPDSLAAVRWLSHLSSAANCQLESSLSAMAAQCQLRCTDAASNQ